jgi:hypothetical protein
VAACGNPPLFAAAVAPRRYSVRFEGDSETYHYLDHVRMRDRYAYYRFPQGTVSYGKLLKDMKDEERKQLYEKAGFSSSEQAIFSAVSKLEGGFETVNTYDTGYVSVGFIQFVTLDEGRHDLSAVLLREKQDNPAEYKRDFRDYGIDVTDQRLMVVVDPATGQELSGNAAVLRVIDDKRLTAVFQRAGRHSPAFRVAQIKVAKSYYWPEDDLVPLVLDGKTVSTPVRDFIHSEAGLATLLDRKINTGNLGKLSGIANFVATKWQCKTVEELAKCEREIVQQMTYRTNFLGDASLGQPPATPPVPKPTPTPPPPPKPEKPENKPEKPENKPEKPTKPG